MRYLGMVGTTFRRTGQEELRRYLLLSDPSGGSPLAALHDYCGFVESVYLATCNRVEVIFITAGDISVARCRHRLFNFFHPDLEVSEAEAMRRAAGALHAYEGEGAAEHLFSVAASLDSMNPGEAQILGQVKAAYREAQDAGFAKQQLAVVFDEAFSAAKRVRHTTRVGTGAVSMLSLARDVIEAHLPGLLVIIGAGEMAEQCGHMFGFRPGIELHFVNRTLQRAQTLAQRFGGTSQALSHYLQMPPPSAVIVTATAAPVPFLDDDFWRVISGPAPLVVDLAVQRDAHPQAAARYSVDLYDLDRLNDLSAQNRRGRETQLASARAMVDDALDAFRRRLAERELAPFVRALRAQYSAATESELEDLLQRVLPDVPEVREEVRRWAQALSNRLAHLPTVGLKKLALGHGIDAVETFMGAAQKSKDPS